MSGPTLLVCGHVTLDRLGRAVECGGSAYYAGRALAALGARPRLFTAAGPDFPLEALAGLDALVAPAAATTTFENAYAPDGSRTQHVLARAPPLDPARLPSPWRQAGVLLLAPVLDEIDVRGFVEASPARLVGLCVQGLVREVAADGTVGHRPLEVEATTLSRVGAAVLGEDDVRGDPALVARLAASIPVVVFTHGSRGCEVIVRGHTRRVGVHPAHEVDPTGAGDVFAAAFLLALSRGDDPVDAARLGAAAASIVVEGRGGAALSRTGEAFARAGLVPADP